MPRTALVCCVLILPLAAIVGGCQRVVPSAQQASSAVDAQLPDPQRTIQLSPEAMQRHQVHVESVARQQLSPTLVAQAHVAFNMDVHAHVGSMVKGRAIEIKAQVGDVVAKGAELIVVESPELGEAQYDYLQRRIAVPVATAAVEPAKYALERAKALNEQNQGVSLAEVQRRQRLQDGDRLHHQHVQQRPLRRRPADVRPGGELSARQRAVEHYRGRPQQR